MKSLIGYWWVSTADPFSDVSGLAQRCLDSAFPGKKKRETVLLFLAPSILALVKHYLDQVWCFLKIFVFNYKPIFIYFFNKRPETLSDMTITSQEEAAEKYEVPYRITLLLINIT